MRKTDEITLAQQVGARVQALREAAGYRKRTDFAQAIGLSVSTVSSLENGDNWLSQELAQRMAEFLRVPVAAFYPGHVEPPEELATRLRIVSAKQELVQRILSGSFHEAELRTLLDLVRGFTESGAESIPGPGLKPSPLPKPKR